MFTMKTIRTENNEINEGINKDFENFFGQKCSFVIKKGGNESVVDNSENMIKIKCDMPGVKKERIEVSFKEDNIIIISAKKIKDTDREFEYRYLYSDNVNIDGTKLTYEDGILIVEIPKVESKSENKVFRF